MKQILLTSFILLCIAFLLPILAAGQTVLSDPPDGESPSVSPKPSPSVSATPTPTPRPVIIPEKDGETLITVLIAGEPTEMKLSDYLYGVVSSEMPALYPEEALKAQAVAARTYALHALHYESHHDNADLCAEFACCMAYQPIESAAETWGEEDSAEYTDKIKYAVHATDGEVLTYDSLLIDALFFAVSSGQTEAAKDVWSGDIPYLQSVSSDWDSESPDYTTTVSLTKKEASAILSAAYPEMKLSGSPDSWFQDFERSDAGGILSVTVGGQSVKGTELRTLFGLKSHNFAVKWEDDRLTFTVTGYGHGVGLSQFGARQMALDGKTYREILQHYYTGVDITAAS